LFLSCSACVRFVGVGSLFLDFWSNAFYFVFVVRAVYCFLSSRGFTLCFLRFRCFLPDLILSSLGCCFVLFFVDGFHHFFWEREWENPFLARRRGGFARLCVFAFLLLKDLIYFGMVIMVYRSLYDLLCLCVWFEIGVIVMKAFHESMQIRLSFTLLPF